MNVTIKLAYVSGNIHFLEKYETAKFDIYLYMIYIYFSTIMANLNIYAVSFVIWINLDVFRDIDYDTYLYPINDFQITFVH